MKLETPVRRDSVRFVCMSCMHQEFPEPNTVPPGDIVIIAGDFTECGRPDELELFSAYVCMYSINFSFLFNVFKNLVVKLIF